ncbi:ion transporter [Vreelandella venusta]|uniref:Preprotein translocase subunit SecA n=1 Tax=Vreelandella venusta TaxID=44935 RepID=A0ABX2BEV0_9GAMM|nr:ion transporter [Halomonas venusta]AZM97213.1 ion transporter [Halomonas venusta]MDX1355031.1 ion transporter [Halomonas venusta]NPT32497.1 preprotein translocase subunit SecA [Halomonas venusta]WAM51498.1 ion transporter [Halomonas venusta]
MPVRERYPQLPKTVEYAHIGWDFFILAAVIINLGLLLFDSLFLIGPINDAIASLAPGFHAFYDTVIHRRFITIDLFFVGIFITDVLLGWVVAIAERRYHRWFFYPFVHWYDVLGCIPLSGFRLLRVLRVVSLLHRLHRLRLINVTRWTSYRFFAKYYDILLEELSDRIALRLLGNVQEQIVASDSLTERVIDRVILPRKAQLIHEIAQRLETTVGQAYQQNRIAIMAAIDDLVSRTLRESPEIQKLHRLPMGYTASNAMQASLSGVAQRLVDELAQGIHSTEFRQLVERTAETGLNSWLTVDETSAHVTEQVLYDILEMLKEQVRHQGWKDRYE